MKIMTFSLILFCSNAYAVEINLKAVAWIESSGNPKAVGDNGKALGLYQLHKGVIDDYNKENHVLNTHSDALEPITAHKIAKWYLTIKIPKYLKYYGLKDTLANRLTAYNMGIKAVREKRTAKKYLKKYLLALDTKPFLGHHTVNANS